MDRKGQEEAGSTQHSREMQIALNQISPPRFASNHGEAQSRSLKALM